MLNPAKMEVIKVTTKTSLERKMLQALHEATEIEIIDVEQKELAGSQISESEAEKKVFQLLTSVSSLIDTINVPVTLKNKTMHLIEKETLEDTVSDIQTVIDGLKPSVDEVSTQLGEINRELQALRNLKESIELLVPLGIELRDLGEGKYFTVSAGSVKAERIERLDWNLRELTDDTYFFGSKPIPGNEGNVAVIVGSLHAQKDDVNRVLASFGFLELILPPGTIGKPIEVLNTTIDKIGSLEIKQENWDGKRQELVDEYGEEMLAISEQLKIEIDRVETKKLMRVTKYYIQFWGFISSKQKEKTKQLIESIDSEAIVEFNAPDFTPEEYPTKLENNKFIGRPYEGLVLAYGPPQYEHDWDPSFFMAFTFPLLFGIMFADVFHGVLLLLLSLYGLLVMKPLGRAPAGMAEEMLDYVQKGSSILLISSIFSIFFGLIFNSFAGLHGEHAPSFMQPGTFLGNFKIFSNDSAQYADFGNATGSFLMLQLSLVIAILHIGFALFLLFVKKVQHKHYKDAILFPGFLLLGYSSAAVLVFSYSINFFKWFSFEFTGAEGKPFDLAIFPFLGYGEEALIQIPHPLLFAIPMLVGFLGFFVYQIVAYGEDGFSQGLDFLISLLGNSISYARLFAINVVHSILALLLYNAFGTLGVPLKLPALFEDVLVAVLGSGGAHAEAAVDPIIEILIIISFIFGTFLTMTMELMITFLQAMRLHLVEFFSKIHFSGSGTLFAPFHAERKFTKSNFIPPKGLKV